MRVVRLACALVVLAACVRPLHRRAYVFAAGDGAAWDHPAEVPEAAIELALAGRVAAVDEPGLARAMARAFRRLRRDQVIHYRHPDGGAWLFGVKGGALVVQARGLRGREVARYELGELSRAAAARSVPKTAELGEPEAAVAPDRAELEVEVAFAIEQFVFVNGVFAGSVSPGESRVFAVPVGRAVVVAADAADGATNAVRLELDFVAGRRQRWSILPEL